MQEQGKRLLVAVALALVVFLGYNALFGKKAPPPPAPGAGSADVTAVMPIGPRPKAGDDLYRGPALPTPPAEIRRAGRAEAALPDVRRRVHERRRRDQELAALGRALQEDHGPRRSAKLIHSSPARPRCRSTIATTTTASSSRRARSGRRPRWTNARDVRARHARGARRQGIHDRARGLHGEAVGHHDVHQTGSAGNAQVRPVITTYGFQDPKTDDAGSSRVQPRVWQSGTELMNGDFNTTAGIKLGTDQTKTDAFPRVENNLQWTGFVHPFLMAVIAPQRASDDENVTKHTRALEPSGLMRTDIVLGLPVTVQQGGTSTRNLVAYFGPKNYDLLDNADKIAGFPTGLRETVDFGHFPLLGFSLAFIGKPLLWLLGQIYNVVGNWGVAIILLTLMVKIVTLFWTTRSMRSMKAMAALSPQAQEIQKKYGDDKAAAQQATMALYKQHGVSPLSGCAPMFLQIPIWSALYIMLSATGELYQAAFIPGWINDLTNSDPTHVLPVLLVATMFLQARLTPQAANQPGQKMMQYGMPLMFGVMSFYFPAGLTLYIFTNTVLSSLHSIYMNKFDKKSLAIAAMLKKNKEAVAAREAAAAAAEAAAKANPGGKKNGKKTTNGGSIKALKATANEASDLVAGADAGLVTDEQDSADDAIGASATTGSGASRPRRKKRRR